MKVVDGIVVRTLPLVPRSVVRRVSAPYIAGPSLDDAVRVVGELNAVGKRATVDVLGEELRASEEAHAVADAYREALDAFEARGLDANVSVKLTALGLELDRGLCRELLEQVVRHAASVDRFVRIDMEDARFTDDTLALYRELREAGLDNVGIVLQAALHRTLHDVADLADLRPWVRLCKGIYVESPSISYRDPDAIRRSFVDGLEALLGTGCRVAVATHDEWLLERSLELTSSLPLDGYEIQMLLGVREGRATELVSAGHRVRIYVPFGQRWYEYSLRRLKENPAMATMIAKATVGRLVGRKA